MKNTALFLFVTLIKFLKGKSEAYKLLICIKQRVQVRSYYRNFNFMGWIPTL